MKKFFLLSAFALTSAQSYSSRSFHFVTLKHPVPFEVSLTEIPNRGYAQHFTAKIRKNGKLIEYFNKCMGELFPSPETGTYRIYCHKEGSSLSVSGRFDERESFTALWKQKGGSYQSFSTHKL